MVGFGRPVGPMTCNGLLFRAEADCGVGGFQRDGDSATRTFRVIFFRPFQLAGLGISGNIKLTWCNGRLLISLALLSDHDVRTAPCGLHQVTLTSLLPSPSFALSFPFLETCSPILGVGPEPPETVPTRSSNGLPSSI